MRSEQRNQLQFAKIEGDCIAQAETYEEFNFVLGAAVGIGASVARAHWV